MMSGLSQLSIVSLLLSMVRCATVVYDFEIGWVHANPDGRYERPTMYVFRDRDVCPSRVL